MVQSEKSQINMTDMLKESKYFSSVVFNGSFSMPLDELEYLREQSIKAQRNLLDDYCEVVYLSWRVNDYGQFLDKNDISRLRECVYNIHKLGIKKTMVQNATISLNIAEDNYRIYMIRIDKKPRLDAQKFISKKNVREFIFKRDKYKCLCCGSKDKLTIDHIKAVIKGGGNTLGNLQTLCKSCNSSKSDKYKDYR